MLWIAIGAGLLGWLVAIGLCMCLLIAASWADDQDEEQHRLDCEVRRHEQRSKPKHYA